MFGYAAGKSAYPQVYSINKSKKGPKKDAHNRSPKPKQEVSPSTVALDGPPSPERIRAYTEQMKRSSIFGNGSRSNTFTSTTPSFLSRESVSAGNDTTSLSRKSSARSNASSMPSTKAERPESIQIFGSIFSRTGRKARKDSNASPTANVAGTPIEEESQRDSSGSSESARRHHISTPYNFQHLTHTRQEHIPDLESTSGTQLASEFSAIRASQVPSQGELKGIRAQDLHFENFSSESIGPPILEDDTPPAISPKSPRRQTSLRNSVAPARLLSARSQDNLGAPQRPPRSPQSPPCPVDLPARTSSRTASILFDTFDPLATTTLERPQTNGGFRRPAPFSPPIVPPPTPAWSETDNYFSNRPISHAVTTPGDEAWPLPSSGTFMGELADVQEEDEAGSRLSKLSYASELRSSMSVPALRLRSLDLEAPQRIANQEEMNFNSESSVIAPQRTLLPPTFQGLRDSWEDDVDFCYENEIEANFDYQWDQCDVTEDSERTPPAVPAPQLHLHLDEANQSSYHGRFRPSLLVPSSSDTPELSPISDTSMPVSDPRTPSNFLRPISHASSFKESHGFTLSPTLLIPIDFKAQMEQEELYDEQFTHSTSGTAFPAMDESIYSNSSYRSSAFSRQSARSSSSTRISTVNSRGSQDSGVMLSRATSVSKAHHSVSSDSSLPELIPSALRYDLSSDSLASMNVPIPELPLDSATAQDGPAPVSAHRRNKSLTGEPGLRRGFSLFPPSPVANEGLEIKSLSPVVETFVESVDKPKEKNGKPQVHGRKTSVPLAGIDNAKFKVRARAATASSVGGNKNRGTYALFPTII